MNKNNVFLPFRIHKKTSTAGQNDHINKPKKKKKFKIPKYKNNGFGYATCWLTMLHALKNLDILFLFIYSIFSLLYIHALYKFQFQILQVLNSSNRKSNVTFYVLLNVCVFLNNNAKISYKTTYLWIFI